MAKKKKTESVEGAEGEEAEAPKSKKKLIIMVTVIVLIGAFAAKTILLKPKPPTAAQVAAAASLADLKLENLCESHNDMPTKPLPADAAGTKSKDKGATTTTVAASDKMPAGPVDSASAATARSSASAGASSSAGAVRRELLLSRFFFPQGPAVLEDPATGSATANLGGWCLAVGRELPCRLEIAQGEQADRPSILYLDVETDRSVRVGGDVVELGRGTITIQG